MAKYLTTATETYRVDTEQEATNLIEEAKQGKGYILTKYGATKKEKKLKGEVIEEWYNVSLVKSFNDEKEPVTQVTVSYEVEF